MKAIRLLIVDDQPLVRQGLRTILAAEDDLQVVAEAADGQQALEAVTDTPVDVVLMDIRMPVVNGVEATRIIKERHPQVSVIMLTTFDDDEYVMESLKAGAEAYLLKDMPADEIADAVRLVQRGGALIPPAIASKVLPEFQRLARADAQTSAQDDTSAPTAGGEPVPTAAVGEPPSLPETTAPREALTDRELEVLACIALGMSNKEVSEALYITEGTVKNHVSTIYAKLQLRDRVQAAIYAYEHGIVPRPR